MTTTFNERNVPRSNIHRMRTFSDALRRRPVVVCRLDEIVAGSSSNIIATSALSSLLFDFSTMLNTSSRRLYVARIQLVISSYCPATSQTTVLMLLDNTPNCLFPRFVGRFSSSGLISRTPSRTLFLLLVGFLLFSFFR